MWGWGLYSMGSLPAGYTFKKEESTKQMEAGYRKEIVPVK